MKQPKPSAVVAFRPDPARLAKMVRDIAAKSENVFFGKHARERMAERGTTDAEALKVFRIGELKGDIEPVRKRGEWKCKFVAPMKGSRELGVATIVLANGQLFVKTVEWEDL